MVNKEKERLMAELFGKKRDLSFDATKDVLTNSNDELKRIIRQNADNLRSLEEVSDKKVIKKINEEVGKDFNLKKLQSELEEDLNTKLEVPEVLIGKASREVFEKINAELNDLVLGQKEAAKELTIAFRRPYVTGFDINKIKNSIILSGSNGSGRHLLVRSMADLLHKYGLATSKEVAVLDMSEYQSPSSEALFLQDLYVALTSKASIIIVENSEEGHALYSRMISELVVNGSLKLNQRYVFKDNHLIPSGSGLTKEVIDTLNGNAKTLVFISESSVNKFLDVYGKSFVDKIQDKVKTVYLDKDSLDKIVDKILMELSVRCKNKLEVDILIDDSIKEYLLKNYSPNDGVDSITPIIKKIYDELVDISLKRGDFNSLVIKYEDDIKVVIDKNEIDLNMADDISKEREEIQKELDEIVGLKPVKEYLLSLEDHLKVSKLRKKKGLKTTEVSKHMIFTGNPGTGKTTIARLVSRLMKACGILKQGQLVEVTRADLVAKYVGQTAPLVMEVVKSALGGVLFIDEAYSLYRGKDDSFGLEAIDTLVKAMEDHRDDLIVILAGYSKEMQIFLDANSGLKSRFANIINFPDYTGEELTQIAVSIAKGKDYKIEKSALNDLTKYFNKVQSASDSTSGNGRLARNLVEEAILNQAKRILDDEGAAIDLLKLEDFDLREEL